MILAGKERCRSRNAVWGLCVYSLILGLVVGYGWRCGGSNYRGQDRKRRKR
jgi:hypothetical protein